MKQIGRFKPNIVALLLFNLFLFCLIPSRTADAYTVVEGQSVYDDAGLLSPDEVDRLTNQIIEIESNSKQDLDIYLLTTNDDQGYSSDDYIDYFFKEGHNDKNIFKENSVILFINMDGREIYLSAYGDREDDFLGSPTDDVLDDVYEYISDGNYYDACRVGIDDINYYTNATPIFYHTWFQLLVALGLGAIIVAIMAVTCGTPITTNDNTYLDQQNSRLRFHHDNYIRTVVTKVKKPENNSSGGGGTHHSGGPSGHSHSGGGRSF